MSLLSNDQKANLQSKLQKLRDDYGNTIPKRLAEISDNWATHLNQQDEASLDQLLNSVHKLAGTAKTYGFPEVSILAGNAEDELITFQEQPPSERQTPAPAQAIEKLVSYQATWSY